MFGFALARYQFVLLAKEQGIEKAVARKAFEVALQKKQVAVGPKGELIVKAKFAEMVK